MILRFILLLCVFTFLPAASGANTSELTAVKLQLKWKHAFQFAGFYQAIAQGYYQQEGLQVSLAENTGVNVFDELISGRSQFGISDSSAIYARLEGKPVLGLLPILNNSPLVLITQSNIETLQQLKGKTLMLADNTQLNISIYAMLYSQGIAKEDLKFIPQTFNLVPFLNKEVAAVSGYVTDQVNQLRQLDYPFNVFNPTTFGFDFYGDMVIVSEAYAKQNPEQVQAFKRATLKGWQYAFTHLEETIALIKSQYNSQNLPIDHLRYEAEKTLEISGFNTGNFGEFDRQKIKEISRIYSLMHSRLDLNNINNFVVESTSQPLNSEEINFINQHIFRVTTTDNWPPFNLRNESGEVTGIAVDFWKLISQQFNIQSTIQTQDFGKVLKSIQDHEADLTLSVGATPDRQKYALFSLPYATYPLAILGSTNDPYMSDMRQLKNKIIAVGRNFTAHKMMLEAYPDFNYITFDNLPQAFEALDTGRADVVVDLLPTLIYQLNQYKINHLKILGNTDLKVDIRFMVRKDYPLLHSAINKAIHQLLPSQGQAINEKWMSQIQTQVEYGPLWWATGLGLGLLSLASAWIYWLRKEIGYRKQLEKNLVHLAERDQLTGIYNRRKGIELLNHSRQLFTRYQIPQSVISTDIDHFKNINDTYGHLMGDKVLKEFTQRIQNQLRAVDYFARMGGEEFLIILPNTQAQQALLLTEKLRLNICSEKFPNNITVTASFGVTQCKLDDTEESLLERVDQALYHAKNRGRNTIVVD